MEREHSELQQHISRTDWWCENLGHWRASITAAEVVSRPDCSAMSSQMSHTHNQAFPTVTEHKLLLTLRFLCVFQATEEGGEMVAAYSVCVTLAEEEESANSRWNVSRKLTEFQTLHRKLTEVTPRAGE